MPWVSIFSEFWRYHGGFRRRHRAVHARIRVARKLRVPHRSKIGQTCSTPTVPVPRSSRVRIPGSPKGLATSNGGGVSRAPGGRHRRAQPAAHRQSGVELPSALPLLGGLSVPPEVPGSHPVDWAYPALRPTNPAGVLARQAARRPGQAAGRPARP